MALAPRRIVDDAEHGKARRRDPNQQVVGFIPDGERVDRWVFEIVIVVVLLVVLFFCWHAWQSSYDSDFVDTLTRRHSVVS